MNILRKEFSGRGKMKGEKREELSFRNYSKMKGAANKELSFRNYSKMKGAVKTMRTLIVITIMLALFGTYLYMANNYTQINQKLNLDTLEVSKMKNTFALFNRSLDVTWFVTTAQIIFRTADESIGCGYDDNRIVKDYWYQGKDDRARDINPTDMEGNPKERVPSVDKYNALGMNPQICYPRDNHAADYMIVKLVDDGFLGMKKSLDADGVTLSRDDPSLQINISDREINATFTQELRAKFGTGSIITNVTHHEVIYTILRKMMIAGRSAVDRLLLFGDSFHNFNIPPAEDGIHYMPNGLQDATATPSEEAYRSRISGLVRAVIIAAYASEDMKTDVNIEEMVLSSGDGKLGMPSGSLLIVKYRAKVRYSEIPSGIAAAPLENPLGWPVASRRITSCFGYRTDPINGDGRFHNGVDIGAQVPGNNDPVMALKDGTVVDLNDKCLPTQHEGCDKAGFGDYGNFVLIKYDTFYSLYSHLQTVTVTKDQSVSAGQEIGTMGMTGKSTGIHLHFEIRKDGTTMTREDPCNYIDCSLSEEEQCIGLNMNTSNMYYYHDEISNMFEKRPVTLEFKAEDYLPAMNCMYWVNITDVFTFNLKKQNDMMCCAGRLFMCDYKLPGLSEDQVIGLGQGMSEDVFPQNLCNSLLSGRTLMCTTSGFEIQ
jgi:hypothetical protein